MTEAEYLLTQPSIRQEFPASVGPARYLAQYSECGQCGNRITQDQMHGFVTKNTHNIAVRAAAICTNCQYVNEFNYRLNADFTMTVLKDGRWQLFKIKPKRKSLVQKLIQLLRK